MKPQWPRPDFLATTRARPRLAWLWALTGLLVLAVALSEAIEQRQLATENAARLDDAQERLRRPQLPKAKITPAADSKADAEAIRAARRLVERLSHPWGRLLSSIEAGTPPGLQWLMFDHDSDSPDVRLEGFAPDRAAVLKLVDDLSASAGWSDVVLSQLQAASSGDAAAKPVFHFEIRAVVDAPAASSSSPSGGTS